MPDGHCPVMPQVIVVDDQFGTHKSSTPQLITTTCDDVSRSLSSRTLDHPVIRMGVRSVTVPGYLGQAGWKTFSADLTEITLLDKPLPRPRVWKNDP